MEEMTAILWLLVLALCLCCTHCDLQTSSQHPSTLPCFFYCMCEENSNSLIRCTLSAQFDVHVDDFNKYLLNRSLETRPAYVHMETDSDSLPGFLPRIPVLHFLSMAENKLSLIQNGVLNGMRLHELNLSHNEIQRIEDEALHDLSYLQVLDLSHNKLSSVSKLVFADLPELKVLNLDHNRLMYFPLDAFSHVPHLEELSVNHNQLSYLTPSALLALSSLRRLGLHNNSLWSLTVSVREEVPTLEVLDVSSNPFHCSCSIAGLRDLFNTSSLVLIHPEGMACFTPLSWRGRPVSDVVTRLQECWKPLSALSYDSRSVPYMDDVQLSCDVQGDPDPAVLWVTPWGHQFADPSHLARLDSVCTSCRQERHYPSRGITFESTVSVMRGGKSLHISHFRGMFNGNITCQAYNYLGNDTATHQVGVYSGIPGTFIDSLFMGAFSAAGFLCFGLFVGSVKLMVLACMARFGKKRKVARTRTPTTAILSSQEDASLTWEDSHCRSHSIDFSDDLDTPPASPLAVSTLSSLPTLLTPNEGQGTPTGAWHPTSILETMEEARWRLRHGVGRSVKTVKRNVQSIRKTGQRNVQSIRKTGQRNVQSIRESGSVYMQNIKETGSTAANKVKAGVVMGMVTMKSHVQSIKEFCGTGDMGTHTISAVSFETNLDTNETTELVKSVTMV